MIILSRDWNINYSLMKEMYEIRISNRFILKDLIHSRNGYSVHHGYQLILDRPVCIKLELNSSE